MGEKIAFIGVGRMGSGMAARLLAAGHELTVYDPDAGCRRRRWRRGAQGWPLRWPMPSATAHRGDGQRAGPRRRAKTAATGSPSAGALEVFVDLSTSGPAAAQAIAATARSRAASRPSMRRCPAA